MEGRKGTVTSLASIFPAEDAKKAAKLVEDSVAEQQKELEHLNRFISDNTSLLNLVQRLPDELFHDVMVPFGKAAFFPGRLIHTNEFLVLLGEGYYADRTSKQTVEILQRRGNVLESQVDSLNAAILDLKAEASFFNATATEAAEGLVEIREDYIEEHPTERKSNQAGSSDAANGKVSAEDEEYARIMSRFDELEKEELAAEIAAESVNVSDEGEDTKADFGCSINQHYFDKRLKISEEHQLRDPLEQSKHKNLHAKTAKKPLKGDHSQQDFTDPSTSKSLAYNMEKSNVTEKPLLHPESKEKVHAVSTSKFEGSGHIPKAGADSQKISEDNTTGHTSKTSANRIQAFTGSIVEHTQGIQTKPSGQTAASSQSTVSNPSKPVSRFKMQKGGR